MTDPLRPADISALAKTLPEEAALIAAGRAYLDEVCSRTDRAALSPEILMAIGKRHRNPDLLGEPTLLRWNNIRRKRGVLIPRRQS